MLRQPPFPTILFLPNKENGLPPPGLSFNVVTRRLSPRTKTRRLESFSFPRYCVNLHRTTAKIGSSRIVSPQSAKFQSLGLSSGGLFSTSLLFPTTTDHSCSPGRTRGDPSTRSPRTIKLLFPDCGLFFLPATGLPSLHTLLVPLNVCRFQQNYSMHQL